MCDERKYSFSWIGRILFIIGVFLFYIALFNALYHAIAVKHEPGFLLIPYIAVGSFVLLIYLFVAEPYEAIRHGDLVIFHSIIKKTDVPLKSFLSVKQTNGITIRYSGGKLYFGGAAYNKGFWQLIEYIRFNNHEFEVNFAADIIYSIYIH